MDLGQMHGAYPISWIQTPDHSGENHVIKSQTYSPLSHWYNWKNPDKESKIRQKFKIRHRYNLYT